MIAALVTLAYLYAFWCIYVLVMGIYRAHLARRLAGLNRILGFPVVLLGYAMDVLANLTLATLIFCDRPREWLVTDRLIRYRDFDIGWRGELAAWICDSLLDPFDPTGNHC
jgi:hypothetical protein